MAYTWPSGDILSFTSQCPHIIILAFISIIFLFFLQGYHRTTNKYPSHGLTNWPILGTLPDIVRHKNQLYDIFTALILRGDSLTYTLRGPWFSSFAYVITCHPPNINHILNSNFPNYPNGPDFIDIFDVVGRGVLTSDGDSWASQRKMATAHLSNSGFRSLMMAAPQHKVSEVLIPLLERAAATRGEEVDLGDLFARLSTDAACMAFLGVDPEYLSPELADFPFANAVEVAEDVTLRRHLVPKQWWKLLRWLRVGRERKMAEAMVSADRFIYQCIERKREELEARLMKLGEVMNESSSTTSDLLTLYMEDLLVDKERRVLVDDPDKIRFIRDTIITMVIAGNDSSGITLAWFFWLVVKTPDVEKKILQELIQIRRSGSSKAAGNTFEEEETEGAVYLHAALLETLRLYPPFPFSHKQAVKGDTLPSGHRVDAGVNVILSAYSMARMEAVWGKDCSEFKPERWIVSDGGGRLEVRHEPTYKFMSFLSGPRTCMGKHMSLSRLKWIIAAVIYNFQFQLVEGHVVEPKLAMMLRMKNGLKAKVSKRVFD